MGKHRVIIGFSFALFFELTSETDLNLQFLFSCMSSHIFGSRVQVDSDTIAIMSHLSKNIIPTVQRKGANLYRLIFQYPRTSTN